jgi:GNAT superfamily N-acetyltransferase
VNADTKSSRETKIIVEAGVVIEPLSYATLEDAIALANAVFPECKYLPESPTAQYVAAIDPGKHRNKMERIGIMTQQHWVVMRQGSVIGLTGLETKTDDPANVARLGWFCLDPATRGTKLGAKTLEWTIDVARRRGYDFLRLDTTDLPSQSRAQKLYEEFGFRIIEDDARSPHGDYKIIVREKVLWDWGAL